MKSHTTVPFALMYSKANKWSKFFHVVINFIANVSMIG